MTRFYARIESRRQKLVGLSSAMKTKWYLFALFIFFIFIGTLTSAAETLKKRRKGFKPGPQKPKQSTKEDRKSRKRYSGGSPQITRSLHSTSLGTGKTEEEARTQADFASLPDVSVTCSTTDFVVRVKPAFYGLGADAQELTLGSSCKSNGVLRPQGDLLFTYPLTKCDGVREVRPCPRLSPFKILMAHLLMFFTHSFFQVIWSISTCSTTNLLRNGSRAECIGSVSTLSVIIRGWTWYFCRVILLNCCQIAVISYLCPCRDHSVHQLAVRPTWQTVILRKKLSSRPMDLLITLMDGKKLIRCNFFSWDILWCDFFKFIYSDSWTAQTEPQVYLLGQTVNIQVSAPHLPPGLKLYIISCYAASSSKSSLKYNIIDNFGYVSENEKVWRLGCALVSTLFVVCVHSCMVDSKHDPGVSKFVSRTHGALKFSIRAFQFTADPETEVRVCVNEFVDL